MPEPTADSLSPGLPTQPRRPARPTRHRRRHRARGSGNQVLVTYPDSAPTALGLAAFEVAEGLTRRGIEVSLRPFARIGADADYQALVVGSADRPGELSGDVRRLLTRSAVDLHAVPTWSFWTSQAADDDTATSIIGEHLVEPPDVLRDGPAPAAYSAIERPRVTSAGDWAARLADALDRRRWHVG